MLRRSRWLLAGLAIAGPLVFAACNNPHLAGGKLHFDQQRYERAKENFELAVEKMPESGEAHLWLGRAEAELGQVDAAASNFDKAASLEPRIAEDVKNAREHYWSELFNNAIAYVEEADDVRVQGGDPTEKFRSALREFQQAVKYNPAAHQTYTNIGKLYFNLGEVDSALTMFGHVREMAPDDATVSELLFSVYKDQGNRAFESAIDAKQVDKNNEAALEMFHNAHTFYIRAAEMKPEDVELNQNRGAVAWELADLQPERKDEMLAQSQAAYDKVLAQEPDNLDVLENLALLHSELGSYEKAKVLAAKLVDLEPKEGRYHVHLGRIVGEMGDKPAMLGELLLGQVINNGVNVDPTQARVQAEKYGPRSDILSRFREAGEPEEIKTYTASGSSYEVWFYWTRGTAYAFEAGNEIYTGRFQKWTPPAEESEEMDGSSDVSPEGN